MLPLSAAHFAGNYTRGVRFHCTLSNEQACLSLYHYGALLWHQIIEYTAPEDIVYYVRLVCSGHQINQEKVTVLGSALSAAEYQTLLDLKPYFAGVVAADGGELSSQWLPVLGLFKKLDVCA